VPSPDSNPDQKPIDWVRARYDSIHGRIASAWKVEGGRLSLDVKIPANTTATVYLPARDAGSVTENGKPLAQAEGVRFMRKDGGRVVLGLEPGSYRFSTGQNL
jgi:alpha-L-rhamnosidase